MPIDTKRMNTRREQVKKASGRTGGDLWTVPEGETKVYIHAQVYPNDAHPLTEGYNFVETVMHYGVGGRKGGLVCLDPVVNPIIMHPKVQEFLAAKKKPTAVDAETVCPVDKGIHEGELNDEDAARLKGEPKWVFGLTPMFFRRNKDDEWSKHKFEPRVHIAGVTIFNGITGEMIDSDPIDITDPTAAVLLRIIRTGTGFGDTEYEVKVDTDTVRKPLMLDKAQRRKLAEATQPGGACDLFKVLANLMKSEAEIQAQMIGVRVEEDAPPEEVSDRKECFGVDWVADDEECQACEDLKGCEEICADKRGDAAAEVESRTDDSGDDEQAGETEADAPADDEQTDKAPNCYSEWEEGHPDCKECLFERDCQADTEAGAASGSEPEEQQEDPPEEQQEDPPEEQQEEPPPKVDPKPAKSSKGKTSSKGKAAPKQEDPELAKIEAEAKRLAAKSRKGKTSRKR